MTQTNSQPDFKTNEALRAKIRALLNMTTMNNCTEAEAMTAAEFARKLMDKYQLELDDLKEVEPCVTETMDWRAARKFDFKVAIFGAVGAYCDCRVWTSKSASKMSFFGRESDAMFAKWLMESLTDFVMRGWQNYQLGFIFDEDYACSLEDFLYGASSRITENLRKLTATRRETQGGAAGSLVVNRKALVDAEFTKLGLALYSRRTSAFRSRDRASMSAGGEHGSRAGFNRPVNGGRKTLLLK